MPIPYFSTLVQHYNMTTGGNSSQRPGHRLKDLGTFDGKVTSYIDANGTVVSYPYIYIISRSYIYTK